MSCRSQNASEQQGGGSGSHGGVCWDTNGNEEKRERKKLSIEGSVAKKDASVGAWVKKNGKTGAGPNARPITEAFP